MCGSLDRLQPNGDHPKLKLRRPAVKTGEEVRCSGPVNGARTVWQAPGGDPLAGTGTLSSSISISPEGVQGGSGTIAEFTTVYDEPGYKKVWLTACDSSNCETRFASVEIHR